MNAPGSQPSQSGGDLAGAGGDHGGGGWGELESSDKGLDDAFGAAVLRHFNDVELCFAEFAGPLDGGGDAGQGLGRGEDADAAVADAPEACCGVAGGGAAFVPWLKTLKSSVGITGGLAAHGGTPAHLPRLVAIATADICHQTNPRPCTAADFEALFKAAM